MNRSASEMGIEPIGKLLIKHAVPSSLGILVMSLNILIDTILVGHWIGPNAIAAINIVLPVVTYTYPLLCVYVRMYCFVTY